MPFRGLDLLQSSVRLIASAVCGEDEFYCFLLFRRKLGTHDQMELATPVMTQSGDLHQEWQGKSRIDAN
jgi:hypothetical protein